MLCLVILSIEFFCWLIKTPIKIRITPIKVFRLIFSFKKRYPHKMANAGIRYATYDKKIGPAFEIIWKRNWKAIAVGNRPKYNIGISDFALKEEGW